MLNLYLRRIGTNGGACPIHATDSIAPAPNDRFDLVLTNPSFAKKSSVTYVNAEGETRQKALILIRDDFWTSTSIRQLNFVQHVKGM